MPMYDYKCQDCGKESLIVLTLKEHEQGEAICPACGRNRNETECGCALEHHDDRWGALRKLEIK